MARTRRGRGEVGGDERKTGRQAAGQADHQLRPNQESRNMANKVSIFCIIQTIVYKTWLT